MLNEIQTKTPPIMEGEWGKVKHLHYPPFTYQKQYTLIQQRCIYISFQQTQGITSPLPAPSLFSIPHQ